MYLVIEAFGQNDTILSKIKLRILDERQIKKAKKENVNYLMNLYGDDLKKFEIRISLN